MGVTIKFNGQTYRNVESVKFRNADYFPGSTEPEYIEFSELNRLASEQVNQFRLALSLQLEKISAADLAIEGDATPIKYLRMHAFRENAMMLWAELPESLEEIRSYAFYNCRKLKAIFNEASDYEIPLVAPGYSLEDLLEFRLELPSGIKTIGSHVFEGTNTKLISLDFAKYKNLTSIGAYAFSGVTCREGAELGYKQNFDEFFRPYNVTRPNEFYSTSTWKSILFIDDNKVVRCRVFFSYPYSVKITFSSDYKEIRSIEGLNGTTIEWDKYTENDMKIQASSGKTALYWDMFTSTSSSTGSKITSTELAISGSRNETWLKLVSKTNTVSEKNWITFPYNINIGDYALRDALSNIGSLNYDRAPSLQFPGGSIGYNFLQNGSFDEVHVPYTGARSYALSSYALDRSNIKRLIIEPGVSNITYQYGLSQCNITEEILIPSTVTSLGYNNYSNTSPSSISSAYVHDEFGNEGWHGSLTYYALNNSDLTRYNMLSGTSISDYSLPACLRELRLPKTVSSISSFLIYSLPNLDQFIIDSDNTNFSSCNSEDGKWALTSNPQNDSQTRVLYSIGKYRNLDFLDEVLSDGVTKRPVNLYSSYWLTGPANLASPMDTVIIPEFVTYIETVSISVYSGNGLKNVILKSSTPPTLASNSNSNYVNVYIPRGSEAEYRKATNWQLFNRIEYDNITDIVEYASDGSVRMKETN